MRGKESADSVPCHRRRITPAYAGKSCRPHSNIIVLGDHPRLCGEKVLENADGEQLDRITPAYAGKSVATLYSLVKVQDHPRLCGEKGKPGVLVTEEQGSPPPMRGKAALSGYDCTAGGITPAYAGKSFVLRSYRPCWRDHPRLCGEKL